MKRIYQLLRVACLAGLFLLGSCAKETSFEKAATTASGTITGTSVFTLNDCSATVVAGNYIKDTSLTSANTITLSVNVDSIGTWKISVGPLGGMTFAGSGTFTAKGIQTITLTGTGRPNAAGTFTIGITAGASTCSFTVTVTDNGTSGSGGTGGSGGVTLADNTWKFTEGGVTYQGPFTDGSLESETVSGITLTSLTAEGITTKGDSSFAFFLADVSGGIQNNETYSSVGGSSNFIGRFYLMDGNTLATAYTAGVTSTGVNLSIKVTNHTPSTKKIEGTFSGTAKDGNGAVKNISGGQFKLTYQ